jgi:hypothetical protein
MGSRSANCRIICVACQPRLAHRLVEQAYNVVRWGGPGPIGGVLDTSRASRNSPRIESGVVRGAVRLPVSLTLGLVVARMGEWCAIWLYYTIVDTSRGLSGGHRHIPVASAPPGAPGRCLSDVLALRL